MTNIEVEFRGWKWRPGLEAGDFQAMADQTDAEDFRAFLGRIGHTQASFARLLISLGDDRGHASVLRFVQRLALGESKIPGEMRVVMGLLERNTAPAFANPPPLFFPGELTWESGAYICDGYQCGRTCIVLRGNKLPLMDDHVHPHFPNAPHRWRLVCALA